MALMVFAWSSRIFCKFPFGLNANVRKAWSFDLNQNACSPDLFKKQKTILLKEYGRIWS